MVKFCILSVQLALASAVSVDTTFQQIFMSAPSPGPMPAMEGVHVAFEIDNMNYYDLTEEWKDPWDENASKDKVKEKPIDDAPPKKPHQKGDSEVVDPLEELMDGDEPIKPLAEIGDDAAKSVDDAVEDAIGDSGDSPVAKEAKTPWPVTDTTKKKTVEPAVEPAVDDKDDAPVVEKVMTPWPVTDTTKLLQVSAALQLHAVKTGEPARTVGQKLGKAIEKTVEKSLVVMQKQVCGGLPLVPAPAPAPVIQEESDEENGLPAAPLGIAPGTAFLSQTQEHARVAAPDPVPEPAPAPAPGPAPGPACSHAPEPKVHVAFAPGAKIKMTLLNQKVQSGQGKTSPRGIKVLTTLYERPNNGQKDMPVAEALLNGALAHGHLNHLLKNSIYKTTGIMPKIDNLEVKPALIPLYDFKVCGDHMTALVKEMTVHYSRRQVPMALLNSCTTFAAKMSFSNDYVLDNQDTMHCRSATEKFARTWALGESAMPKDLEGMCANFCEAKYGNDAPQCRLPE